MRAMLGIAPGEILVATPPGKPPKRDRTDSSGPLRDPPPPRPKPGLRWVLALAPGFRETALPGVGTLDPAIAVRQGEAREILGACDLALTASGTATLEGALLGCPMIVLYKMHPLTWFLARRLVRIPHVAMANLLAGERIVPEYLQGDAERGHSCRPRFCAGPAMPACARRRVRGSWPQRDGSGPGARPGRAARVILDEVRAQ